MLPSSGQGRKDASLSLLTGRLVEGSARILRPSHDSVSPITLKVLLFLLTHCHMAAKWLLQYQAPCPHSTMFKAKSGAGMVMGNSAPRIFTGKQTSSQEMPGLMSPWASLARTQAWPLVTAQEHGRDVAGKGHRESRHLEQNWSGLGTERSRSG